MRRSGAAAGGERKMLAPSDAPMNDRDSIGPREIGRILEAARALGLHPEAVRIPLGAEGGGSVSIEGGKLVIVAPAAGDLDAFIGLIANRARALPGFGALKRADG